MTSSLVNVKNTYVTITTNHYKSSKRVLQAAVLDSLTMNSTGTQYMYIQSFKLFKICVYNIFYSGVDLGWWGP